MRQHRHDSVSEQWCMLKRKVQGHNAYYGITGNSRGIGSFSYDAQNAWFEWLNRRGGKKPLSWEKYSQWLREVFHWPAPRSRVAKRIPPPEEPDTVVPHVRVCEGASGQLLALLGGFCAERAGGSHGSASRPAEQGRNLVKCLDTVIKNRFRNDAETLGAWKTASHITASGGGSERHMLRLRRQPRLRGNPSASPTELLSFYPSSFYLSSSQRGGL